MLVAGNFFYVKNRSPKVQNYHYQKLSTTSVTNIDTNFESAEVDGDIINIVDGVKSKRLDVNDYRESYYRT